VSDAEVPLLESKLHVPRRRRAVVPRARLDQRLDRSALPPVVLVSAPAGFGKTTLLTEWLAADGQGVVRAAWLSLDRRDSDPSVFWSYVIAAFRQVVPEVGVDALAVLQATPGALENVVATLLNDLAGLEGDVVLVLDDYHVVESMDVHESMLFLVEHLSRAEPSGHSSTARTPSMTSARHSSRSRRAGPGARSSSRSRRIAARLRLPPPVGALPSGDDDRWSGASLWFRQPLRHSSASSA
jgi:hypothetical protein